MGLASDTLDITARKLIKCEVNIFVVNCKRWRSLNGNLRR